MVGSNQALILSFVGGFVLAALCFATGFLVVGMGHGWELPRDYGALTLLFYPLALARLTWIGRDTPWPLDALLTLGWSALSLVLLIALDALPPIVAFDPVMWIVLAAGAVVYIIAGWAMASRGRAALVGDAALLVAALALDIAAIADFRAQIGVWASAPVALLWLPFWLGWQVVAAVALRRHVRR